MVILDTILVEFVQINIFTKRDFFLDKFLPSFESVGLSIQEKKFKIQIFKMAAMADILDFPLKQFLAIFDLAVALTLSTKFGIYPSLGFSKLIFKTAAVAAILDFGLEHF